MPPTIALGTNPTVCQGTTSANLAYSATTNNPDKYNIDYNSLANAAGFIDIVNANLPVSPIILVVPSTAVAGTYYGTLKVKNSNTGLLSTGYLINVKIISIPATPGAISGMTVVSNNSPENQYSISTVSWSNQLYMVSSCGMDDNKWTGYKNNFSDFRFSRSKW